MIAKGFDKENKNVASLILGSQLKQGLAKLANQK
jgi:hypothetical protein